jgi:2,3-bisphosphoglycerate-dependent phosphoglycerate mutase
LIRHAQSHPTSRLHYSAWPLSSTGKSQAEALASLLEPLGIERLFSSPFRRCLQTVRPFSRKRGISITIREGLRERLVAREIMDGFGEIWRRSWEDFDYALPGCETSRTAQQRFVAAMTGIVEESGASAIALSTHGAVIGLFLNWIDAAAGRRETEALRNPDVLRVQTRNGAFAWDRDFRLPGIEEISTDHRDTPVSR